jgi:hypothetical protein
MADMVMHRSSDGTIENKLVIKSWSRGIQGADGDEIVIFCNTAMGIKLEKKGASPIEILGIKIS